MSAPLMHEMLTEQIIGAAIEVHRVLGPGLLESAYEACLAHELTSRGVPFTRQQPMPVAYKGLMLDAGYRLDLLVDGKVLVELKAVEKVDSIHEAQLMTYMRLSGIRVGLLINFNVKVLHMGVTRRVI